MALPIFKSFWPTTVSWHVTNWVSQWKAIVDNRTGALVGIQSQNSGGPDGIWAPVPLSTAQIATPDALILADINAVFQLDGPPYSRYRSNGVQLIPLDNDSGMVIPPGFNEILFSPLVITEGHPLIVEGAIRVIE